MCRGLAEEYGAAIGMVSCELCSSVAVVYCQADDAYLCRDCDQRVHGANLLALRHIRCILCTMCHSLTQRYLIGSSVEVMLPSIARPSPSCSSTLQPNCSSASLKVPVLLL